MIDQNVEIIGLGGVLGFRWALIEVFWRRATAYYYTLRKKKCQKRWKQMEVNTSHRAEYVTVFIFHLIKMPDNKLL